jgi:hypothetical protein
VRQNVPFDLVYGRAAEAVAAVPIVTRVRYKPVMARAVWSALTEHLRARGAATVQLSWDDLDAIVGGMPASATNHYPQWWHGDRPNTRA